MEKKTTLVASVLYFQPQLCTYLRALVMESPASPATSFPLAAARTDKRVAIRTTKLPSISSRTESQRSTVWYAPDRTAPHRTHGEKETNEKREKEAEGEWSASWGRTKPRSERKSRGGLLAVPARLFSGGCSLHQKQENFGACFFSIQQSRHTFTCYWCLCINARYEGRGPRTLTGRP